MAKVLNPLNSVEARGKMNGLIYNSWRGISYVKAFKAPVNPQTEKQMATRALLADISQDWRALTQIQRDSWITYADAHPILDWTGNPKRITGLNWFVSCNAALRRNAILGISEAPTAAAPATPSGFALATDSGNLEMSWVSPVTGDLVVEVGFAWSASPGRKLTQKDITYRSAHIVSAAQPVEITEAPLPGMWTAFAHIVDLDTGLVSPDVRSDLVIT